MEKQFVTYEIALALKELKFNKPCIAKYCRYNSSDNIKLFPQSQNFFKGHGFEYCKNSEYKKEEKIAAPLWQQCEQWFRDKYNIHITITSQSQESWQWHIQFPHDSLNKMWEEDFYTYEEAREQAILKCIELCKKDK